MVKDTSPFKKKSLFLLISIIILLFSGSLVHAQWSSVSSLPSVSNNWFLNGVYFTSSSDGWAVGRDVTNGEGVLLHYDGTNWSSVNLPSVSANWSLNSVYFTSSSDGWAVGYDFTNHTGVLLHYDGSNWSSFSPPSVSADWYLYCVYFTSSSDGWAVGGDKTINKGVLLHYDGTNWSSVNAPSVSANWSLNGVYFTSSSDGWAVGGDYTNGKGVLLHYDGSNWRSVSLPSVSAGWWLNGVYFTSSSDGWAVGRDGINNKGVLLHYYPPPTCAATLDTNLNLHIPIINFNNQAYYWADFAYIPDTLDFTLTNAGVVSDTSSFNDCSAATLSSDFKLHVPTITFSNASYWADFQYAHDLIFTLTGAGQN